MNFIGLKLFPHRSFSHWNVKNLLDAYSPSHFLEPLRLWFLLVQLEAAAHSGEGGSVVPVLPAQKLCRGNREGPPVRVAQMPGKTASVQVGIYGSELGPPPTPGHSAPMAWLAPAAAAAAAKSLQSCPTLCDPIVGSYMVPKTQPSALERTGLAPPCGRHPVEVHSGRVERVGPSILLKFPFQCVPLNPLPHRVPTADGEEAQDSELRDTQDSVPVPSQAGKMHHPNSQSKLP